MDARKYILLLALIMVAGFMILAFSSGAASSEISHPGNENLTDPSTNSQAENGEQTFQSPADESYAQAQALAHQARMRELEYQAALRQIRLDESYAERAHELTLKFQAERHAAEILYQKARYEFELAERQRQADIEAFQQIALIATMSLSLLSVFFSLAGYIYRRVQLLQLRPVVDRQQPARPPVTLQRPIKASRWDIPGYREAAINLARRNEYLKRQQVLAQGKPAEEILAENLASVAQSSSISNGHKNGRKRRSYYDLPLAD